MSEENDTPPTIRPGKYRFYRILAKVMLPLSAVSFAGAFVRFQVVNIRAHRWGALIVANSAGLGLLVFFIGFWITVRRRIPISEVETIVALATYLALAGTVFNYASH